MEHRIQLQVVTACISASLLLAGCASSDEENTGQFDIGDASGALAWAADNGFDDVVAILKDGVVTAEEYAQGHELGRQCKEALGMRYGEAVLDPISGTQLMESEEYRGTENEGDLAAFEACDKRYFFAVESVYLAATPQKMDAALLGKVQECLQDAGVSYSGDEASFEDFYAVGETWAVDDPVAVCVLGEAKKLYPGLPSYALGF